MLSVIVRGPLSVIRSPISNIPVERGGDNTTVNLSARSACWPPEAARPILVMQPRESRSNVTDTFDRLKAALAARYVIEHEVSEALPPRQTGRVVPS